MAQCQSIQSQLSDPPAEEKALLRMTFEDMAAGVTNRERSPVCVVGVVGSGTRLRTLQCAVHEHNGSDLVDSNRHLP
jgi:hypothetical protein